MTTGNATIDRADGHYTIITADSHAGGSHAAYREYLDPQYHEDFDAWRGRYRNPFKDLGDQRRLRNWDNEMRNGQQEADGIVGEVIFPNTVPPFFPSFVLFAAPPKPEDYEHRLAGIRAHNRWLVDFCAEYPEKRAGIGQIFLNDIDDAIEDVRFIKEHNLRGGLLLPNVPPDVKWVKPVYDPEYDRLWEVIQDLEVPINVHGGTGAPDYGNYPFSMLFYINEVGFYSQRPLVQFVLGGVFERFPRIKFVITETGCSWVPPLLKRLDQTIDQIRRTGQTGEIRYGDEHKLNHLASEYFARNVWMGVSQPGPADAATREYMAPDRFMWGSDYPHDEGTYPYSREHLRQVFPGLKPDEMQRILAENVAELYDFDLKALAPLAAKYGPTVEELATPLDKLPDEPNEALLKAVPAAD
ncbi:MAG TPA: amidohydrolase family protein [Acidimicrobiales bacterium]|nr:amidohydrolase family protein [Acidimicrobiales bacterium]